MKIALLILMAVMAGCQSATIGTSEMEEYVPDDTDQPSDVGCSKKNVAFMAYLGEHYDLRKNETIIFDQVLLNDGNAYSPHTGIFTAPFCGVYSFSFAVHTKAKKPLNVRLMVNDMNIGGAVAEGNIGSHDSKGGHMGVNSAVIHVCYNQYVYVESTDPAHIEGSQTERYTTFSGHLLYLRKKDTQ